jgi:hypothetical protein
MPAPTEFPCSADDFMLTSDSTIHDAIRFAMRYGTLELLESTENPDPVVKNGDFSLLGLGVTASVAEFVRDGVREGDAADALEEVGLTDPTGADEDDEDTFHGNRLLAAVRNAHRPYTTAVLHVAVAMSGKGARDVNVSSMMVMAELDKRFVKIVVKLAKYLHSRTPQATAHQLTEFAQNSDWHLQRTSVTSTATLIMRAVEFAKFTLNLSEEDKATLQLDSDQITISPFVLSPTEKRAVEESLANPTSRDIAAAIPGRAAGLAFHVLKSLRRLPRETWYTGEREKDNIAPQTVNRLIEGIKACEEAAKEHVEHDSIVVKAVMLSRALQLEE